MLRHFILITIRNLARHLNFSIINIGGLAIGLASFIFIILYITDELKYDSFHDKADSIYRVNRFYNSNNVNEDAATCSFPFAPTLQMDYPGMVKNTCRFFNFMTTQVFIDYQKDDTTLIKYNESGFFLVDSTVFQMFSFPFIKGNPETALSSPNTVVLTESTAARYFGDEDPVGKTMRLNEGLNLEVTGVIKDVPSQSHFRINFLGSMSTFRQAIGGTLPQTWIWNPCWTYIELGDNILPEALEARFPEFYTNHYPDLSNQDVTLSLQKLTDIHLQSHHDYEMHANSNVIYVYILSIIAVIVLSLACINFMNLTTANSTTRTKEIGIKKTFGADRIILVKQFIGETIFITLISLIIACLLVELLLPGFNQFTDKSISGDYILAISSIGFGIILVLGVGLLAGAYPAFYLSSFNPIVIFRGGLRNSKSMGNARKILVTAQFAISIALIIGTLIVYSQLKFIRKADLGFNKDQIILLQGVNQISRNFETFKENLLKYPEIESVTAMEDLLGANHNTRGVTIEGLSNDQQFWYPMFIVRSDFVETFDIEVVEGRSFSKEIRSDTANAIMINETMAKNLGWTNEEALGKRIVHEGDERVIGVFRDFHILSLHKPMNNFILDMVRNPGFAAGMTRYIAIRVNSSKYTKVLDAIEEEWNVFAPNRPFEYSFLAQELQDLYTDEDKFGKFSIMLTILALVIASLGLIGLTSYIAEQRTKEIGIRRAMGATLASVIRLLSNEFVKLILLANLIAWPIAYLVAINWLNNFTKRIPVDLTLFLFAGLGTLIIAILITSYRALRASSRNPADTLRYE
ncbi:MAG: ABC transporter permease [Bacteroidales bacterium]|nr:ABC transporter permease [Bacteroidales bacterium]